MSWRETIDSEDDNLAFIREARLRGISFTLTKSSGKQTGHGDGATLWTSHPRIRQPENFFSEECKSLEELRAAGYATGFRIESVRVKDNSDESDEEISESSDQGSEEEEEEMEEEMEEVSVNPTVSCMRPCANVRQDKEESGAERLPTKKSWRSKRQQGKRCSFTQCLNPDSSSYFYTVAKDTVSGGQDWTPLAGMTLCQSCYSRYRAYGNLHTRRVRSNAVALQRKPRVPRRSLKPANLKHNVSGASGQPSFNGRPTFASMVTTTLMHPGVSVAPGFRTM